MAQPIPGPRPLPILGNVADIDPVDTTASLSRLANTYGPIFKLTLGSSDRIFVGSHELLDELCDETRFSKTVGGALMHIRDGVGDGLFTAHSDEHNWGVAHRVLMPAFGPLSIREMFDEMYDIASQLVVKWARFGPKEKINVTDDFTRLTLDSIALCAMGTRFNSFYHEEMHPFVDAMVGFLSESGARATRPSFATYFMRSAQQKFDADIALMKKVSQEVVDERKANPNDKKDLLNTMIKGRDPKTGEGLTDQSIINNMITFLIAGHETTSGLLSFLFYNLIKNPSAYQAAQRQVDEVIGRGPITVEHMSKLPYIEACMRETLRLTPTAPAFGLQVKPDYSEDSILLGGKYEIKKGQTVVVVIPQCHRDPSVFGDDADLFKPERMLDEPFSKLPKNSWKPFGNGMRGCIGRAFAWQETILTTALLLQNFNFRFENPGYTLQIKQTLTIKPKDFFMHATLRDGIDSVNLERMLHVDSAAHAKNSGSVQKIKDAADDKPKKNITILYGSNAGTCESLAQNLARTASGRGFNAQVQPLDSAVDQIPKQHPVVLISSSYEGQPPDNAAHFVEWLQKLEGDKLSGVKYASFGCGNHDWTSTFHRIPKLLDTEFESHGATRVAEIGLSDVAGGDVFNDFDKWQDEKLWPSLGADETGEEFGLQIDIDTAVRRSTLRQDLREAVVVNNTLLTAPGEEEKRHITLTLPTGVTYKVGDYLAVLPINDQKIVRRVMKHYSLPWDAVLTIKAGQNTTLPTYPISIMDVLGAYVELNQPASRKNVARIAASTPDEGVRSKILALAGKDFDVEIANKRRSPLDLLEEYPSAALSFGDFLNMLPPMRVRQYSISSSPLADPTTAALTWAVIDTPSKVENCKRFLGVASNYMSNLEEHDRVHVAVKPSHGNFHLPSDIENTPVIMVCAGTGIAPFRGFVQERAMQVAAGRKLAPAYLFIGCHAPDKDALFAEEFAKWESEGVVKVYYAYSRAKDQSKGCRHVQERIWEEREEVTKAFNQGGRLYVCGSAMVGESVRSVAKRIYQDYKEEAGEPISDEEVEAWFDTVKERYASDVFG